MINRKHWQAYILLIFTTGCWGLNAIISRLAVGEIAPMQLVTFRWLGVVILLLIMARKQVTTDWPILKQHLPFLCLMGSCGFTVFNALFYAAGHHTTAINIGILQGSIPIFVFLGSFLALSHRISLTQALGVSITMLGVIIVALGGDLGKFSQLAINRGDLLMLIACFFYAAYSVGLSRRPKVSAMGLFAVLATAAWIASLPLVAIETWQIGWQSPTATGWLLVLLVTIFPSFVSQICFIHSVSLIGPGRAGVFVNLVPIFASIMAVIFLNEAFEVFHAIALAMVLSGIGLSELGKPKKEG